MFIFSIGEHVRFVNDSRIPDWGIIRDVIDTPVFVEDILYEVETSKGYLIEIYGEDLAEY